MKPTTQAEMYQLIYGNGQNNKPTIIFHEDPGHGWLQVPITLAKKLGIEANISGYSYMDSKFYYLEEDCDITALTNGLGLCYKTDPKLYRMFIELIPREWTNGSSPVRNKQQYSYSAPKVSTNTNYQLSL
jgi:hypothetical protein